MAHSPHAGGIEAESVVSERGEEDMALQTEEKMRNMKWQDMVRAYPDRWVAAGNAIMDGTNIVSGPIR